MKTFLFPKETLIIFISILLFYQHIGNAHTGKSKSIVLYLNSVLEQCDSTSLHEQDLFAAFTVDVFCSETDAFLSILKDEKAIDNICYLISLYNDSQMSLYPLYRHLQKDTENGRNLKIKKVLQEKLADGDPEGMILACFQYCSRRTTFERIDVEDLFFHISGIEYNVEASEWAYSVLNHMLLYSPDLFLDVLESENKRVKDCVLGVLSSPEESQSVKERDLVIARIKLSHSCNDTLKNRIIECLSCHE